MAKRKASEAYLAKLRDPRWQKMRLKIMERDEFRCHICMDNETTLHVHHCWYIQGNEPWEYPEEALVTLCENCHEFETDFFAGLSNDITQTLREHFFANDLHTVREILISIGKSEVHVHDVVMTAVNEFMAREENMRHIIDWYFKMLADARKSSE